MTKQFEGDVQHYDEKGFGFIRQPGGGRIFFSAKHVQPDWKGSRAWCFSPGIPVKFEVSQRIVGGEMKTCAANVQPIFEMSEPENIGSYRESSEVINLNHGFGFLRRPCGDAIFFHKTDVVQGFEDRWDLLQAGSPVWHGVKLDTSTGLWRAANVELYSYQELESFTHENDPAAVAVEVPDPEPAPDPAEFISVPVLGPVAIAPQSELLRPENKKKSLFELIQERKLQAV